MNNRLSMLAQGKGLLNGGVEIECIPDYRYNRSLSGNTFLTESSSSSGKHAKVFKPYSLSLPKTYVTRRGQMMLFTSPDDMIIGRGLQPQRINQLSHEVIKELKTTDKLCESTENYESDHVGERSLEGVKPGHFTSVYLKKLRSVQATQDDEVAVPSTTDVPISFSDSGIDSSASHQTILNTSTSGRTSSLSNRTDSSIVIPNSETHVHDGHHGVNPSELTDIIFTVPQPPTTSPIKKPLNLKRSSKRTMKKKSTKTKSIDKGGSLVGCDKTSSVDSTNGRHQSRDKPTGKKRLKGKNKLKPKQNQNDDESSIQDDGRGSQCGPSDHSYASEEDYGSSTVVSSRLTSKRKGRSNEERKALLEAKANERRLLIEKKRIELESIKATKQLQEEKNKILKEQILNQKHEMSTTDIYMEVSSDPLPTAVDSTTDRTNDQQQPDLDNKQRLLAGLQEMKDTLGGKTKPTKPQHEPINGNKTEVKTKRLIPSQNNCKPVEEHTVKLKENEVVDYRTRLGVLANGGCTGHTSQSSHYFSYFSYVPKKKSSDTNKKNVRKKRK